MRIGKNIFMLAAAFFFFGFSAAIAQDKPLEKVTIAQYGKERILFYLPLYVAIEEGLFAKHGLDVGLTFAGTPDHVFAAVISNDAQFGVSDPAFTAISHDKGGPGKVVAMLITKLAVSGAAKNAMPAIKHPQQLNGLRIASPPEPSTTYTLINGLKRSFHLDTTIVQVPPGEQIALLDAGKADLALDFEPNVSIAEDKGYHVVFDLAAFTDPQVITGVTTTEDFIKSHSDTVQKLADGLQEAIDLIYNEPDVAFRVGAKSFPHLSDKIVRSAVNRMLNAHMYPRSIAVPDGFWQRTLKTRLDNGDLKKPQETSVAVDNDFALQAQKDASGTK